MNGSRWSIEVWRFQSGRISKIACRQAGKVIFSMESQLGGMLCLSIFFSLDSSPTFLEQATVGIYNAGGWRHNRNVFLWKNKKKIRKPIGGATDGERKTIAPRNFTGLFCYAHLTTFSGRRAIFQQFPVEITYKWIVGIMGLGETTEIPTRSKYSTSTTRILEFVHTGRGRYFFGLGRDTARLARESNHKRLRFSKKNSPWLELVGARLKPLVFSFEWP